MATYTVELFGLSNDLAGLRSLEVDLDEGASLSDLVRALRETAPALNGRIIRPGEDKLASHYSFNVNGRFYMDEYDVKVQPGDHILMLTLALGG